MDRLTRYARSARPTRFSAQYAALAPAGEGRGIIEFQGKIPVRIEFRAGEFRDNRPGQWSRRMNADYGELPGIPGADGDAMDCYVGPNPDSPEVFVIHQVDKNGEFDEHKVMLGYDSETEAVESYLSHYPPGWKLGPVKRMTVWEFAEWANGMRAFNGPSFEDIMRAAFLAPDEPDSPPEPSGNVVVDDHGFHRDEETGQFASPEDSRLARYAKRAVMPRRVPASSGR